MKRHLRNGVLAVGAVAAVMFGFARISKGVSSATPSQGSPVSARPNPLKGVAAIVELDVVSASYTYDDVMGPRTQLNVANVIVHAGNVGNLKTLSQFGGALPDGSMILASGLPVLAPGSHYILFLGADPWFYTPVWTYLAFRTETVGSRSIVVGFSGAAVTRFSAGGVTFGKQIVDLSGPNDQLTPRPRLTALSDADPEIASALDPASFVSAAKVAAIQAGADFTGTAPTAASLLGGVSKWNIVNGTAAPTP